MTKITHWSNVRNYNSIMADGVIELEGYTTQRLAEQVGWDKIVSGYGLSGQQMKLQRKEQSKWVGQYVWFTEEEDAKCTSGLLNTEKVGFQFDADEIGAERWTVIAQRQILKKGSRAKKLIRALNAVAKQKGDDITKWWVVKKPVSLELCKNIDCKQLVKQAA